MACDGDSGSPLRWMGGVAGQLQVFRQGGRQAREGKCLNACYFAEVEGFDLADSEFFPNGGADDQDMIGQSRDGRHGSGGWG